MSTPNAYDIQIVPGFLCANPTDLTIDFPHGGTALGECRDIYLEVPDLAEWIPAEEYGGLPIEGIERPGPVALACSLRSWDPDLLPKLFQQAGTGTTTQKPTIALDFSQTSRPGAWMTDRAFRLCFSPKDPERHNFIMLYNAVPARGQTAKIALKAEEEMGLEVVFRGSVDSSKRVYKAGRRRDVSPT